MKIKRNNIIINICIICVLATNLFAQKIAKPMLSSTKKGVHIFIRGKHINFSGFQVYRKDRGYGKKYKLLTKNPIKEINDVYKAQEELGAYYDYLRDFLKTNDPNEILHRMKSPDVSTILRYCGVPFAKVLGRYYYDDTAIWQKSYVYKIVLLNIQGKELHKIEVKYKVEDNLPVATSELTLDQQKDKVKLSWNAPKYKENVKDDFIGFNVYRKTNSQNKRINFLPVLRRDNIQWTDDTAKEENNYEYSIKPVDILGREGKTSATFSIYVKDLIAPLVPEGLTAKKDYQSINLKWNQGEAKDITTYKIFRGESLNSKYVEIGSIKSSLTEFIDSSLIGGKPYFYKIQAIDNAENASPISPAIWSVAKDTSAPLPPQNIEFQIDNDKSVILKWEKPQSLDIQGYFVSRGYKSNKSVNLTPTSITSTTFRDKQKFNPGHTYYYHVSAIDLSFNQSKMSTIKVTIPDDKPPRAPEYCDRIMTENGFVEVGWQPSMSLDVKHYQIFRWENNKKILLKTFGREPYGFIDSTVIKGVEYFYSVIAVDSADNQSSEIKCKPITPRDITPPPAPENLKFEIDKSSVKITWSCKQTQDFKGYNIYRTRSKYGTMRKINTKLIMTNNYHDKDGKKGRYYKITSLDTSGNETASKYCKAN